MGFLSGLGKGLLSSGQSGSASYQDTFSMLPQEFQGAYKNYATNVNNQIPNALSAYTPMGQTADETAAFDAIRQGFAPTQESLTRDVGMLMNPFDQFVVNDVNRQAQGDFSILKQNLNQAGQFGSNRQQLGANDIEQTRLGTIGKLRQDQYNQALNQLFSGLIPQRQADAQGMLGIGDFQRKLGIQTASAPITGLQQIGSALGVVPSTTGTVQTGTNTSSSPSGAQTIGTIASIASMLSDRRAKENIIPMGVENGWPIYEFSYLGEDKRYIGVMADEVDPEAVFIGQDGFARVNYEKLGVMPKEVL